MRHSVLLPHLLPHTFHPGRPPHRGPTLSRSLAQIQIPVPEMLTLTLILIPRRIPTQVPTHQPPILQGLAHAIESGGVAMTHRVILIVLNKSVDTPCVRPFLHSCVCVHAHILMHSIISTRLVNEYQFICLFLSERSPGNSKVIKGKYNSQPPFTVQLDDSWF